MQTRALREYATRRGWTIALQVKEIGSGASQRERREQLLEAARRREIDVVLVWRLDRWGRSVTDLLATLQELEHLGVGFVSLTEALDLTTPAGRAMAGLAGRFCRVRKGDSPGTSPRRLGACPPERPTPGPATHSGPPRRPSAEAPPCRHQQIRNRPPLADRPDLRPSHPSVKITLNQARPDDLTHPSRNLTKSDVLDRVAALARAARLAGALRRARVGQFGPAFTGMGDFAVPPAKLEETLGIETIPADSSTIPSLLAEVSDRAVEAEMAYDREHFLDQGP